MESQEHFKAFSYIAQEINSSSSPYTSPSPSLSPKLKQALRNISNFFALTNDQNIVRPLFAYLPQDISSSLFGSKDNGKRGLFHNNLQQNDAAYLIDFLKPSGPFLQKLLALQSDNTAIYNISPDYLPPLSRRIVQSGEWSLLSSLYKKCIQSASSGAAPNNIANGGMSPAAHGGASPAGPNSIRILFNMFEYYMFCFALCANMVSEKNIEVTSRKSPHPPQSLLRFGSVPTANPSAEMVLDKAYYNLIQVYLSFFLPSRPPPVTLKANSPTSSAITTNPMTPNKSFNSQYGSSRIATPKPPTTPIPQKPIQVLDNSNIFKCASVDNLVHALGTAQFAVEVLAEVWLGLNEWEVESDQSPKTLIFAKPQSYVKPSSFHMRCISTLIKYLVSLGLNNISSEQLSRIHCDRSSGQSDVVYDINKAAAYLTIAPKLYRHICLALQNWSRDDSVSDIVDQWLYYAFPWKHSHTSTGLTEDWFPFVADNYLFYTRVLQLFFNRALLFDFYSRPAATKYSSGISSFEKIGAPRESAYLKMTESVISHFSDPKLLELLKAIENALCSLKTYNSGGGSASGVVSAFSSPVLKSAASSSRLTSTATSAAAALRKEKLDIGYQFRNSGPKTRQRVIAFEGKYHYSPVFIQVPDAMKDKNSNLPSRLACLVWEARERLTHFKHARAAAAQKDIDSYNEKSMISSVFSVIETLFSDGSSTSNAPLTQEQLVVIDRSIDRLEKIVDTITDIWGLPNPSQTAAPAQFRRTNSDLMGLLQEDMEEESNIKEWAPGVCEPQRVKEIGNVLTLRGRNQIKFGLRKSASEAVPLILSPRAKTLIKHNEIENLVLFANSIALAFEQQYEQLREQYPYLPEGAGLYWIRFFASWDNLVLSGFIYLFLRWFLL